MGINAENIYKTCPDWWCFQMKKKSKLGWIVEEGSESVGQHYGYRCVYVIK